MDNLAHTLAGLALAEAGLRRKTAFGATTLAIAANLPDVDAMIYLVGDGVDALAFRRGWTHGVLAMVVLPVILAACMLGLSKLRGRAPDRPIANARWLLVLSAIGVCSHPLLDLLNTYGVRLLMPFSGQWFYGDALFIIDPWFWLVLLAGVLFSRRLARPLPARIAVAVVSVYALAMAVSSRVGRVIVERQAGGEPADRVMISPVLVTPFQRRVVRDLDDRYQTGELTLGTGARYRPEDETASGRGTDYALAAARTPDGAAFLSWSRFPRFAEVPDDNAHLVRISDMRYADVSGRGWASIVVRVPPEAQERAPGTTRNTRP